MGSRQHSLPGFQTAKSLSENASSIPSQPLQKVGGCPDVKVKNIARLDKYKRAALIASNFFGNLQDSKHQDLELDAILLSGYPRVLEPVSKLLPSQIERCKINRLVAIKKNLIHRFQNCLQIPSASRLASIIFYDTSSRIPGLGETLIAKAILKSMDRSFDESRNEK